MVGTENLCSFSLENQGKCVFVNLAFLSISVESFCVFERSQKRLIFVLRSRSPIVDWKKNLVCMHVLDNNEINKSMCYLQFIIVINLSKFVL